MLNTVLGLLSDGLTEHLVSLAIELRSSSCPKLLQDCVLDFFSTLAADFCISAYRECRDGSDLFEFLCSGGVFTSWLNQEVVLCYLSKYSSNDEMTATLNDCHSYIRCAYPKLSGQRYVVCKDLTSFCTRPPTDLKKLLVLPVRVSLAGFSRRSLQATKW